MDIPVVDQQIHAQTPANLKVPAPSVKEVVAKAPPSPQVWWIVRARMKPACILELSS